MKKIRNKTKRTLNITLKVIAGLSTLLALLFLINIFKLNLITFKYLIIITILVILVYVLFNFIIFKNNLKLWLKILISVFLIVFGVGFSFGMHYVDKTSEFLHKITGDLEQSEEFYVKVLDASDYKKIDNLKNKKIGSYIVNEDSSSHEASIKLKEVIDYELITYTDVSLMLKDLEEQKIDAILLNGLIDNIIMSELDSNINWRKIYSVFVPIEKEEDATTSVNVTKSKFNIFVAGCDNYGSINQRMNTDVNMVISVDPINKKILLTSIPRDYYVMLVGGKGSGNYDKLTHAGYDDINVSIKTVEKLLDIDMNYYVKINFSTVEKLVDAIGGVDVYSDRDFCTYYDHLCYNQGLNHLDGYLTLMFARERKAFINGDIQRNINQQRVIEAIVSKISSSAALITNYTNILKALSDNIAINMDEKSISKLVKMQLDDMAKWEISRQNLTGHDAYKFVYSYTAKELYVMLQDEKSVQDAISKIKEFMK